MENHKKNIEKNHKNIKNRQMKYQNIQEQEIKNKITIDYFKIYDCTKMIGNIDFCVTIFQESQDISEQESLLWAEAKTGNSDLSKSITQLILTIGKARTFDKFLPPNMLGAFDGEKMAFVPYNEIHDIFYINDFNWNVTPSKYDTKEFKLIHEKVKSNIDEKALLFYYEKDDTELKNFIKDNFKIGNFGFTKTKIDKNNFITIYNKWLQTVKPTIVMNWDMAKKSGIIDGDFYLADLLSSENRSLKDSLYVLLKKDEYQLDRKLNELGIFDNKSTGFTDKQKAHTLFWSKYERPPKEEYWDYIVGRRDLLVPQDIRERKGSFFTPQIWVELSQKYLTDTLGENWQDEYYIWDCAAGTGNLLAGLTNKKNIWASTLDKQDVDVIHDRIENGANLWKNNVFQFDFLNDSFDKLPKELQDIIKSPKKCEKLVVYINPPYAEAGSSKAIIGTSERKAGVTTQFKINDYFKSKIGNASNEIFALFMANIYEKIPNCKLAQFSKLKFINGLNFKKFKNFFLADYLGGFIVPAETFDNVTGKFPIGFTIWNTSIKSKINKISTDIIHGKGSHSGTKIFYADLSQSINKWIKTFDDKNREGIGFMSNSAPDFQQNNYLYLQMNKGVEHVNFYNFTQNNIIEGLIYFAVRHCISATWLNDRDQFLYPKDTWENDTEFQNDCFIYGLFHGQNRISNKYGINNWIPFIESEVGAKNKFESKFMAHFIAGKLKNDTENKPLIKTEKVIRNTPLVFSKEAKEVFEAGKNLWTYYHKQPKCNANASLYDIRSYFQGRNESGKMNHKSADSAYMQYINILREKLKVLAKKIEPKVYEHGFLLK